MVEHKCGILRLLSVADEEEGYKTVTAVCDECQKVIAFKHCFPIGISWFVVDTEQASLVEPAVFEISHEPLEKMVWADGCPVQDMTKLQVIDLDIAEMLYKWTNEVKKRNRIDGGQ